MLQFIACSGFKSLKSFKLEISRGLNILVGPNGSGKTNIILFLEFLGALRRGPLTEAVSSVGGAGRIFRRSKSGRPDTEIDFFIKGEGEFSDYPKSNLFAKYEYSATILLVLELNEIVFSRQNLMMKITDAERTPTTFQFEIGTSLDPQGDIKVDLIRLDASAARYATRAKDIDKLLREQILETCLFSRNLSLIDLLRQSLVGPTLVSQDLLGAKALNIEPNKVREAEDVATPPIIRSDGIGFAATMFALQPTMGPHTRYSPYLIRHEFSTPDVLLREILAHASIVNESIRGIYVQQDTLESKLRVSIDIAYEAGSTLRLPISLVSDGTAKWLALVAAVITNRSVFAIEEPENFLHPAMQREIINLVRSQYDDELVEGGNRFAIMTTHSETILDNARPDELIVVDMELGETRARRPKNAKQLAAQISKTGFGLGHFYKSGAVE